MMFMMLTDSFKLYFSTFSLHSFSKKSNNSPCLNIVEFEGVLQWREESILLVTVCLVNFTDLHSLKLNSMTESHWTLWKGKEKGTRAGNEWVNLSVDVIWIHYQNTVSNGTNSLKQSQWLYFLSLFFSYHTLFSTRDCSHF